MLPLLPEWYFSAVTAFFFLSLGVNTLVTGLIVYKIITVYHDIRGFRVNTTGSNVQASAQGNASGRRDLYPLISILIESGLITFVGQLTQSIMYKSASFAFPLVSSRWLCCDALCKVFKFSIVEIGVIISFTYYKGNFDNNCTCMCWDGGFLRPYYINDGEYLLKLFEQVPTEFRQWQICDSLDGQPQMELWHLCAVTGINSCLSLLQCNTHQEIEVSVVGGDP